MKKNIILHLNKLHLIRPFDKFSENKHYDFEEKRFVCYFCFPLIWIAVAIYLNSLNQPQWEVCLKYGDEDKSVKSLRMPTTPDFREILIRKGILMSLWLKWAKASRYYINYILGSFYFYLANICSILDNFLVKKYELLKIKVFRNPTHIIFMLPVRLSDYRAVGLSKSSSTGSGYIHEILNIYLFTSYFKTT